MHRFFVPPEWIAGDRVIIEGKLVHQLRRVLRLGGGERITVLDDSGYEYEVELGRVAGRKIEGEVLSRTLSPGEPGIRIVLFQGVLKAKKFEYVLQKGTELGIAAFVPVLCQRSVTDIPGEQRMARWQEIIREAAEQSHRGRLPALFPATDFGHACAPVAATSLLLQEGEKGLASALGRWPAPPPTVNLFVGPEGGFSAAEVEIARQHGIVPVGLGRRILRAETAALVATAAILYHFGELGDGERQ